MDTKYTYENYLVTLSKLNEGFLIQFDDPSSGTVFSKVITDHVAKDASDQSFDAETLYQMLKDFFDTKPEKVTLSLTPDGKLSYSCPILLGNVARKMGFTIYFGNGNPNQLEKIERIVNKLCDRVSALENSVAIHMDRIPSFEGLETRLAKTLERVEKLTEERCDKLEKLLTEKMSKLQQSSLESTSNSSEIFHFNPDGAFGSFFVFSDENRTARAKTDSSFTIFAKEPLLKTKRSTFSFLIREPRFVSVGIARDDALESDKVDLQAGTFGWVHDGRFLKDGDQDRTNYKFKQGDKVSFTVDLKTGEFLVILNNQEVGFAIIPKERIEGHDFYPFLLASSYVGGGATFV